MAIVPNEQGANADSLVETLSHESEPSRPQHKLRDGLVVRYRNGLPVICRTGEPFVIDPAAIRREVEKASM